MFLNIEMFLNIKKIISGLVIKKLPNEESDSNTEQIDWQNVIRKLRKEKKVKMAQFLH